MFRTPTLIGWGIALLIVVVMGVLVFAGPFHLVNKSPGVEAAKVSYIYRFHSTFNPAVHGTLKVVPPA